MSKKHAFLSQVFMTLIMATTMSGLLGLIFNGPSMEWLMGWPRQFVIAWPIAFALTMFAWPLSMKLAGATIRATARAGERGAEAVAQRV